MFMILLRYDLNDINFKYGPSVNVLVYFYQNQLVVVTACKSLGLVK